MNKRRRPYSVNGAVLIMVLTVMFVLIFLLAGAVAVVYTSNNRVMMQYEESQAYYTARSVIDIYREMILQDDTEVTGGKYYELQRDLTTHDVTGTTEYEIKTGRALELDLYRVPVATGIEPAYPITYNPYFAKELESKSMTDAEREALREKLVYSRNMTSVELPDGVSGALYNAQYRVEDAFKSRVTAELTNNGVKDKKASSNKGIRSGFDDTLVYYVNYDGKSASQFSQYSIPKSGTETDSSMQLADKGTLVKLYVQVLDRKYEFIDNDGNMFTADKFDDVKTAGKINTWEEAFQNGNREHDYFAIKVTSEVQYLGETVQTSVIYSNENRPKITSNNTDKGIVSLTDITGANTLIALGGGASLARDYAGINGNLNDANLSGDVYLQSSMNFNSTSAEVYLENDEVMFTRGNMKISGSAASIFKVSKGSTIFCADTLSFDSTSGSNLILDKPVNIIAKKLTFGNEDDAIAGQGIFEEIGFFGNGITNGKVKLADTAGAGNNYYANTLYLDKNQNVFDTTTGTFTIDIDKCIGDNSKLYIKKIVVCEREEVEISPAIPGHNVPYDPWWIPEVPAVKEWQYKNEVEYTVPSTFSSPGGKIKAGSEDISIDYDGTTPNAQYKKEMTLPVPPIADPATTEKKITLETVRSLYTDYFKADDGTTPTWKTTGDTSDLNVTYPSSTYEADLAAFVNTHVKTAEDYLSDMGYDLDSMSGSTECHSFPTWSNQVQDPVYAPDGKTITGYTNLQGTYTYYINSDFYVADKTGGNFLVDTTAGDVIMMIGKDAAANSSDKAYAGQFTVFGDNDLIVCVPGNTDGVTVTCGDSGGPIFSVNDYRVRHASSTDTTTAVEQVDLRSGSTTATPSPHIQWYVSSHVSKLHFDTYNQPSMGYVKSPKTTFEMNNMESNCDNPTVITDGFTNTKNTSMGKVFWYGSVFCKKFKTDSNKVGLVFIPNGGGSSGSSTPPGDPLYKWPGQYYIYD